MNSREDGFTLMESLASVAIILIVSSLLAVAANATIKTASKSLEAARSAVTITRIDRYIRGKAGTLHIPYWADGKPYIDALSAELYRSKIGPHIKSIAAIQDSRRNPRGIEVVYRVYRQETRTVALFPSVAVMEKER